MDALAQIHGTVSETTRTQLGRTFREFAESRTALAALGFVVVLAALALLAPLVAPQNPYDLAQISIMDNKLPPGSHGFSGLSMRSEPTTRGATCFRRSCSACG